jgi:glycosyltransferase involved in cell wall biosynthesis
MRITFVLPDIGLAGGVRVVLMLADQLRARGNRVLVVAPPPAQPGWRDRAKALLRGRGWLPAVRPDLSYLTQLGLQVECRMLERHRAVEDRDLPDADVVVASWWLTAEWVARLSPSKGAKAYFLQQLEINCGTPADRVEATWRLPLQKIVCSQWLADLARERFADPTAVVVPNGIDPGLFHAPPRGKQPRPTVGLLYSPGVPVKATATALGAVAAASARVRGLLVRAFGTGPVEPGTPLPPGSVYTRLPPQQVLREIYSACDVWLCSSTSEGFHLPPHEAMACRCPVVSTRVGGPVDLIRDGENGYLVEVGDVQGLADRLVRVLTAGETEWQRLSEAAHARANEFTWPDAADRFAGALGLAVAAGAGRPQATGVRCESQP